jgi:hypothetical protein
MAAHDLTTDKESITVTKLHEHQVKRKMARKECFVGSQRRIVNQHRTGFASRFTLKAILKTRYEHSLTEEFDVQ